MKTILVRIKTWEEMEQEFGLDPVDGYIDVNCAFTHEMEELMPENRIIDVFPCDDCCSGCFKWVSRNKNGEKVLFHISKGMIKDLEPIIIKNTNILKKTAALEEI